MLEHASLSGNETIFKPQKFKFTPLNTDGNYITVFQPLSTNSLERTEILLLSMQKHKWTVTFFFLSGETLGVSDTALDLNLLLELAKRCEL